MSIAAIIVASGEGLRFGGHLPKQYADLNGKQVITHTLQAFTGLVDDIVFVINKFHEDLFKSSVGENYRYVFGGARRQDSVYEGLKALKDLNPKFVLIHDSVRPLVSPDIISSVVSALKTYQAVDVGLDMQDTIKQKSPEIKLLDRSNLYATQTPQGFHYKTIMKLYEKYNHKDFTDDISMAIEAGIKIGLVQGSKSNIKITTQEDLEYATYILDTNKTKA